MKLYKLKSYVSLKTKKQFARKKTDPSKRLVTYDLPVFLLPVQAELDKAIRLVMGNMQSFENKKMWNLM
uniref:ParB family protein n=1 Tax=Klebsiella pneumoniae TaxID=573 RepID=A0A2P1BPH7_KLEPN|nr:ParB family protein [Klebsiella pneumoniae]